jgi:hypothetical protein
VVRFGGDHYRFERFEIAGGSSRELLRGLYNVADGTVIRDTLVRDCPLDGIAGSDRSGSLTLERVEVRGCGQGSRHHAIYVGSDHSRHPGTVFRMLGCHVHDGNGGNLVKSRVARTEILFCRIEGSAFYELDLIGGDPDAQDPAADRAVKESADLIGNLIASKAGSSGAMVRLGSDGTGPSEGFYRFAHNTFVANGGAGAILQVRGAIGGIVFANNAVFRPAGRGNFWTVPPGKKQRGTMEAAGNWISDSVGRLPEALAGSLRGGEPGFEPSPPGSCRPGANSPLKENAAPATAIGIPPGFAPLAGPPALEPPGGGEAPAPRPAVGRPDIGAFEGR